MHAPAVCFVLFLFFLPFFSSPNRSLKRSSRTTLERCFLGRRNRGSVLRLAKRVSDMMKGEAQIHGDFDKADSNAQVQQLATNYPVSQNYYA